MGQGWPFVTTLGAVPERGKFRVAKPGCRVRFLFGYFLFRASKEKVTRRKGETVSGPVRFICGVRSNSLLTLKQLATQIEGKPVFDFALAHARRKQGEQLAQGCFARHAAAAD